MSVRLSRIRTADDLWTFAREHGLQEAAQMLRAYVRDGEPRWFCEGYTTRAMCRVVSKAADGAHDTERNGTYIETTRGPALYDYMWGDGPMPKSFGPPQKCSTAETESRVAPKTA